MVEEIKMKIKNVRRKIKGNESENSYTKRNQNYRSKNNHQCGYYTTFIHVVFFLFGISSNCVLSTKGSETLRLTWALGF